MSDSPFRILNDQAFLEPVVLRNTGPDGQPKDPALLRRMENPICKECHETYRKKFPGRPFEIVCDGIYDERDFKEIAEQTKLPEEQVRELLDKVYWASKHIQVTDENGDFAPFVARDYQEPVLRCTAKRKVDRLARGTGKTLMGIIEELHVATTNKNYPILVLSPRKSQAQKWYDDLLQQIENDAELSESLQQKKQAPYYVLKFRNGSSISIFTAGSQSGREADVVRSQSPRRVRLEEQDMLTEGDYKAVMPLVRRYKGSEVHGSSTPTGARSIFWSMCTKYPDYREFYAPIYVHPDWSPAMEEACRREARTEVNYKHEFLAEFGDLEQGVFRGVHVDAARRPYLYKDCRQQYGRKYVMGVDWNGQGTGTRIRIVEFDPATKVRRMVSAKTVDGDEFTATQSVNTIRNLNRTWNCDAIYIDAGFGHVQDELLRLAGKSSEHLADRRLLDIKVIDFGATITTNKLVSDRSKSKYLEELELERRTKPFMVEGAVMVFEQGLFEFSDRDDVLDAQLRAYQIKTWSLHGHANTYTAGKEGDHDLDAMMLALLGVEMEFGLFANPMRPPLAHVTHVPGFGQQQALHESEEKAFERRKQAAKVKEVPSRQLPPQGQNEQHRLLYMFQRGLCVAPRGRTVSSVPSRTSFLKKSGSRITKRPL